VLTFDNALNYPNDGTTYRAVNFKVGYDITAPAAFNITYPAAGSTIDTLTPTVTWDEARDSLSGIKNYTVKIGSYTSPTITDRSFAIPAFVGLINGSHTVQVIAEDNAGNTTTSSSTFNISTRVPPEINITSPASGSWNNASTVRVIGSAQDESRVNSVEILVNGVSAVTIPGPSPRIDIDNDVTVTAGADNIITVRALDDTGLTSEKVVVVKCDTVAPSAPVPIYPLTWATANPTFRWEPSTDNLSGVAGYRLTVDGTVTDIITDCAYAQPTALDAGDHTYSVTAYDNAGNSAPSAVINFKVDNTAPGAFTVTAPTYADAPFEVVWTMPLDGTGPYDSGIASFKVYIGEDNVAEVAAPATSARIADYAVDGDHELHVAAYDAAGNTTSSNIVNIETNFNNPACKLLADDVEIANGDFISGYPVIIAKVIDLSGIASVKIYIDDQEQKNIPLQATEVRAQAITACDAKQDSIKLNTGKHTIRVIAQDKYGKETTIERKDLTVREPGIVGRVGNYPNPFATETTIHFYLTDACDTIIRIYDLSGRLVWVKNCSALAREVGALKGDNEVSFSTSMSIYGDLAIGAYAGIITDAKSKVLGTFDLAVYR